MSSTKKIHFITDTKEYENIISQLANENRELKEALLNYQNRDKKRGVYQIVENLNSANKTIQDLKNELEQKELDINGLKEDRSKISSIIKEQEIHNKELLENINDYEKAIEVLNNHLANTKLEKSKINELLKDQDIKIQEYRRNLECQNKSQIDYQEKIKILNHEIAKLKENILLMKEKFEELEILKNNLLIDLEEKNKQLDCLHNENIAIKHELNIARETKELNMLRIDSNIISNMNEKVDKINDLISPDQSFQQNFQNKFSSENFVGLADNLKDELQYNKTLKKIDILRRDNEKLTTQIANMKEEHKLEIIRLNITLEELFKFTNINSENLLKFSILNEENNVIAETGKVNNIVKNIQNRINEATIEELKKEKKYHLETITKLKSQIEAMENATTIDFYSNQYTATENNRVFNSTPERKINTKSFVTNFNNNCSNKDINNFDYEKAYRHDLDLMEKNQNEIRERERKIEYLLQVLEEKNNLIEQLRDSDKLTSTNQSFEAREQIEFMQFQNENLLKEIEEKNLKIKKLNKDLNDQIGKYEILHADFQELQEKENDTKIYIDEIDLLKNKMKEYEQTIEKMKKELNIKSNKLIRKETEVTTLKADRATKLQERSYLDNKSLLIDYNTENLDNPIIKDPKINTLNKSLNEIKDLKEKLRQNKINRSMRSNKTFSIDNTVNNSYSMNLNNSIHLNITNGNVPRALFEEEDNNKNENNKVINKINNSLNSINNSLAADIEKFNKIDFENRITDRGGNKLDKNKKNFEKYKIEEQINSHYNNQALFVSETTANSKEKNDYKDSIQEFNNIKDSESNSKLSQNANNIKNHNYSKSNAYFDNDSQKEHNYDNEIELNDNQYLNNYHPLKKNYANPNIKIFENILPEDIIQSQDYWDQIRNWIANSLEKEKENFSFQKVFKAKVNGFDSEAFFKNVENKKLTITIIKNNHGKILGGFTSLEWETPVSSIDFLEDSSSKGFIFSLTLAKKYDLKENAIAVCHSINSGPIFGLNDLEVVENADKTYNYFSNIGTSYIFDDNIEDFYGEAKYLVEDYEVYEIISN